MEIEEIEDKELARLLQARTTITDNPKVLVITTPGLGSMAAIERAFRDAPTREQQLEAALRWVLEQIDSESYSEGIGNPGHSHRRPGRWDTNGKPCKSCLEWQQVRQLADPGHKGFRP